MYDDEWISCRSPVPPRTTATLTCENSYQPETILLSGQRKDVRCNANGEWEPEPMRCIPGPLMINIYINDTQLTLHTAFDRNNPTFIEILDDRVIIHTKVKNISYSEMNVRDVVAKSKYTSNSTATDEPWAWS